MSMTNLLEFFCETKPGDGQCRPCAYQPRRERRSAHLRERRVANWMDYSRQSRGGGVGGPSVIGRETRSASGAGRSPPETGSRRVTKVASTQGGSGAAGTASSSLSQDDLSTGSGPGSLSRSRWMRAQAGQPQVPGAMPHAQTWSKAPKTRAIGPRVAPSQSGDTRTHIATNVAARRASRLRLAGTSDLTFLACTRWAARRNGPRRAAFDTIRRRMRGRS